MTGFSRLGVLAAGVCAAAALLACSASTTTTPSGGAPAEARATSSLSDLASMLSGRFRGSSPGNALFLDLGTVQARTGTQFDAFLTVSGRYRDNNVRRSGLLRLSTQGRDVHAAYIPHFDPTVTSLSQAASRFTQAELDAACDLYFSPSGDGYYGETRGSTTCAPAMPGAVGKWTIEVDPSGIRVRNADYRLAAPNARVLSVSMNHWTCRSSTASGIGPEPRIVSWKRRTSNAGPSAFSARARSSRILADPIL
jgi:hypothetical protein